MQLAQPERCARIAKCSKRTSSSTRNGIDSKALCTVNRSILSHPQASRGWNCTATEQTHIQRFDSRRVLGQQDSLGLVNKLADARRDEAPAAGRHRHRLRRFSSLQNINQRGFGLLWIVACAACRDRSTQIAAAGLAHAPRPRRQLPHSGMVAPGKRPGDCVQSGECASYAKSALAQRLRNDQAIRPFALPIHTICTCDCQ